ncbi:MAG TPA: bifunctional DNA-formamidopyrimidine glycosylase/DNA-(apurinic or apyrimidinic site) lyase [Pirellulales bacterium]|nr:bifunctional DNA-formamidopyrimidine glycosylase/DNA-(apurinic or apyrimidinic site) lyase [Pirellulales bacterium]
MPELPEVETMRRGVAHIAGRRITGVERPRCTRKPILVAPRIDAFRRRAVGRRITRVDRVGKRVVLRLDSADAIVLEPRMTGLVLVADPPTCEHLRLRITLDGAPNQLLYWDRRGLGLVRLVDETRFVELYGNACLGPDALAVSAGELKRQLKSSRRAIKVALLDQRAVAGIGNLYASEILHLAAVHPARRCDRIKSAEWPRIHAAMREVLETAIRFEGSTLSDGTYRNALNQDGGYQNHHRVYDRAGQQCVTCGGGTIQRIVQAQRSTFFCTRCQSKR